VTVSVNVSPIQKLTALNCYTFDSRMIDDKRTEILPSAYRKRPDTDVHINLIDLFVNQLNSSVFQRSVIFLWPSS
jgi:hypothetical protein